MLAANSFFLSFVKIMFITLNPHSQSALLHGIVFTSFVKGGKATGNPPLPTYQNILKIHLKLTRRFPDGFLNACFNICFAMSEIIAVLFGHYFGILLLKVSQNFLTSFFLFSTCHFSVR
jgi:hypothetical protein